MFSLHTLSSVPQKRTRRVGRGAGSGRGTYAGRGLKGQRSRTGGRNKLKRLGVKQYLAQLPKNRGFTSASAKLQTITLTTLNTLFAAGAQVTLDQLVRRGVFQNTRVGYTVVGSGELTKPLTITASRFSQSALAKIKAAGGTAVMITPNEPKKRKKQA